MYSMYLEVRQDIILKAFLHHSHQLSGFCGDAHHHDSLHMNIRLGWDYLELEPDEKCETSMRPRQAVIEVTVLIPRSCFDEHYDLMTMIMIMVMMIKIISETLQGSYLDALTTDPSPKTTSYSSTASWYNPTWGKPSKFLQIPRF